MTKSPVSSDRYYYAGGKRIELSPADDLCAVSDPEKAGFEPLATEIGRSLGGGLRLLSKGELAVQKFTNPSICKYPVFRSHGAILVALPEVRIEESRVSKWEKLNNWLDKHRDDVTILSRDDDRLVLSPVSGSGADALTIANDLTEEIGPEMAQARFIRVTPRPN
jgi:hypothetical protein